MLVSDFDYHLPEELIAQEPLADRSSSRMLVVYRTEHRWEDRSFREFPGFVHPGDCLILNNSKVFPSRLFGTRASGTARVEVFLIRALEEDRRTWQALVRPGRKLPVGERVVFSPELSAEILTRGEHGERTLRFHTEGDVLEAIQRIGHMPLPPYVRRADRPEDQTRYNTVYASVTGSVAAPTAGLHFTPEILGAVLDAGAGVEHVTLHVGLGTFAPIHAEHLADVKLHSEQYSVEPDALERIRSARRRIVAGTTATRTLETVYATGRLAGETDIFISPGYRFRAVDCLLTNFHLPKSSLMMLVSAFAGRDLILAAYEHAVRERYRFFSFGDCMLIV